MLLVIIYLPTAVAVQMAVYAANVRTQSGTVQLFLQLLAEIIFLFENICAVRT